MNLKLVSWNVRGLGRAEKVRAVRKLVWRSKATVLFLQESKLSTIKPGLVDRVWGSKPGNMFSVPSNGTAGGLISVVDPNVFCVDKQVMEDRVIMLEGKFKLSNFRCNLFNIYAPNDHGDRERFFDCVSNLISASSLPVIIGGDFNVIKDKEEKMGGRFIAHHSMALVEFIQRNNLIDLPLAGGKFTWCRGGECIVASRLDMFLISPEVLSQYPSLIQEALPRSLSDHNPIIISEGLNQPQARTFKFFNHWADNPEFTGMIRELVSNNLRCGAPSLLRIYKKNIKIWVAKQKEIEAESTEEAEKRIHEIESMLVANGPNSSLSLELQSRRASLWTKYRQEEREWIQKARVKGFKAGDRNTKFFHISASIRAKQNHISLLEMENKILSDHKEISKALHKHFSKTYNVVSTCVTKTFVGTFRRLDSHSVSALEVPFTQEEVWEAIKSVDGSRAPGPDGFNLDFYKKFWAEIKGEVMKFFDDFYNGTITDTSFNHSYIVLIPKDNNQNFIEGFRPISLVSSLYKILAKVLSRRLAKVMGELVGETQFAFTAGKQVANCSLIANEVIDHLRRNKGKAVVFKADFRKAYDTVDWGFLDFIKQSMGFGMRWRSWIQLCLSTASISVLVNGSPTERFSIKRGLWQGCPLSPLLFNLVGEALSILIHKAIETETIKGVALGNEGLSVSHLQFADDLVLFLEAKEEYIQNMKRILRIFELASGLSLNLKKTKLYGVNVNENLLKSWADAIKCGVDSFLTYYLGLPLGHSRNSSALWESVVIKVRKRLEGWKGKLLSFAGRLILIKSVLCSLPVFYMSVFQMPASGTSKINKLVANFLWGNSRGRNIHWVKWDNVVKPKKVGGLGFYDIALRNRALLNKWSWRYSFEQDKLWRKVIDAKYSMEKNSLIPRKTNIRNGSWIWNNIASNIRSVHLSRPKPGSWNPPNQDELKFNVDAAVRGSFGIAADPTSAEICAIGEALHLFVESDWSKSHKLLIESDSLLAVSWISKPQITPPSFQANIAKIRKLLDSHAWKICFAFRENNDVAHKLAK
ncbi:hypothetical protein GQ457_05G012670 [Hibiscus cannabinus]